MISQDVASLSAIRHIVTPNGVQTTHTIEARHQDAAHPAISKTAVQQEDDPEHGEKQRHTNIATNSCTFCLQPSPGGIFTGNIPREEWCGWMKYPPCGKAVGKSSQNQGCGAVKYTPLP